jgi:hypothetical protein
VPFQSAGSLIVCLRDNLMLQLSGEKRKEETTWSGLILSIVD